MIFFGRLQHIRIAVEGRPACSVFAAAQLFGDLGKDVGLCAGDEVVNLLRRVRNAGAIHDIGHRPLADSR